MFEAPDGNFWNLNVEPDPWDADEYRRRQARPPGRWDQESLDQFLLQLRGRVAADVSLDVRRWRPNEWECGDLHELFATVGLLRVDDWFEAYELANGWVAVVVYHPYHGDEWHFYETYEEYEKAFRFIPRTS